jgi:hypothetical protein
MFEIAGEVYYFDLERLSDFVRFEVKPADPVEDVLGGGVTEEETIEMEFLGDSAQMIDVTKWDMLKGMTETLLNEQSTSDNKMGLKGLEGDLSMAAKLSFNTLLKYKILSNE